MNLEKLRKWQWHSNVYAVTIYQWAIALMMLWLTRFIFIATNHEGTDIDSFASALAMAWHGLIFDISAATYFCLPFLAMRIIPCGLSLSRKWLKASEWVYGISCSVLLMLSLADVAYFRFTGSRMRWGTLQESLSDSNTLGILGGYLGTYWWLCLLGAAMIWLMMWLYGRAIPTRSLFGATSRSARATVRVAALIIIGFCVVIGLRGRWIGGKSLSIGDANALVTSARQTNAVLNTPFTIIRTAGKAASLPTLTFYSETELAGLRSSVHTPAANQALSGKNVMIIIIESGGAEFIDYLAHYPSEQTRGTMPFVDSLARQSLVCDQVMATGVVSTGGANAVLCGFPTFEPLRLMTSIYAATPFDAPARLLGREGYESAFYYGCTRGSFYIDQLAIASGYSRSVDRQTYPDASDFDGKWGIFDEPMGIYTAKDLSTMHQPWIATWFTISAHGPFTLPDGYDTSRFRYPEPCAQRGLEYTDTAIRAFFAEARKQPWYENTIFIITGDHGNRDLKGTIYDTPYIKGHIPLIIYAPDGSIEPRRVSDRVMGQYDIAATVLDLVGYSKPYISIGSSLFDLGAPNIALTGDDGRLMVTGLRYVITTDPEAKAIEAVYDITTDPEMRHPLTTYDKPETDRMWHPARALLQDLTTRLNSQALSYH